VIQSSLVSKEEAPDQVQRHEGYCVRRSQADSAKGGSSNQSIYCFLLARGIRLHADIMHPLRSSGRALHDTLDHHSSDAREHGLGRRG